MGIGTNIGIGIGSGKGGAVPSTLLTDLSAYWNLDEESDGSGAVSRIDSVGGLSLTDNGTAASAAALISNGCNFVSADSTFLSLADNPAVSVGLGVDFTVGAWVKRTSVSTHAIAGKWGATNEWLLALENASASFYGHNGTVSTRAEKTFSTGSTGVWYFILGEYDVENGLLKVSVNNGTPATAALASGIRDAGTDFGIGAFGVLQYLMNGVIDEIGIWKRLLTDDEKVSLYNGGAGVTYPF